MSTLAQHLAASADPDLLARIVAAAEQAGIEQARHWAETNRGAIVAASTGESTLADVYAYALSQREAALAAVPPPPGVDPTVVTDDLIRGAVQAVHTT